MLKFYRNVLAAGVVALGLAACGDNVTVTNPPSATPVVHSVVVVPASLTVTMGQTNVTFVASVVADSGISSAVNWTSTNPAVATVSGTGVITTVGPGQTTIVATSVGDNTKTGAGSLQVVALPPNIAAFSVSPTNTNLAVGGSIQASSSVTTSPGAPAATITWASSNNNIATVSATGQITGVASGTVVITATATSGGQSVPATIGVTVGTGPAGVISFSVSPSAMTLFTTQTQQATATVVMAPTFAALPVTWTSLAPTVATVSGTGLVTAVAQGTAVVTATIGTAPNTLTQSIVVTVAQAASISINAINQGASSAGSGCPGVVGAPVVLTNVACQIDVVMNLTSGLQPLDSLVVRIKQPVTATNPTGFKTVAKQNYGNTIASTGLVTLSVNTANFVKIPTNTTVINGVSYAPGTVAVDLFNGPTTLQTQIYPHIANGGVVFNCQVGAGDPTCAVINSMVLNNVDGWAADIQKCSGGTGTIAAVTPVCPAANPLGETVFGTVNSTGGFANDVGGNAGNVGTTYWGGPTGTGQVTAEVYAVIYNDNPGFPSGSSLNRCNNTLGNNTGCINSVTWSLGIPVPNTAGNTAATTPNAGQWCAAVTQTTLPFRRTFGSGAGATSSCANYENVTPIRDNIDITASIDGVNNPFTVVGTLTGTAPIAGPANPNFTLIPNSVVFGSTPDSARYDWVVPASVGTPAVAGAESFNWVNANWAFGPQTITDNGVGPAAATWRAFASANGGSTTVFPTAINTGLDLAETNQNCAGAGCDGYNAAATGSDRLGNTNRSGTSGSFGDDRTAPPIRISIVAAPSAFAAAYTSGGTAAVLDSTTYAAFEGIYGANVVTAGQQTLFIAAAAGTNDSLRIESLDGRSGLSRFVETTRIFAQGGATGLTSTVYTTSVGVPGATVVDGWITSPALHVTNGRVVGVPPVVPGYFTTTEYVIDRAGNVSGCPAVGTVAAPITISGSICAGAVAGSIAPSVVAGTNPAVTGGGVGAIAASPNEFARRTLAIDPGQPLITGVSPNNSYVGNAPASFALGSQDDLEVIDARLRIQYPNLTIGDVAGTIGASQGLVWSYSLSSTFLGAGGSPNGNTCNGPTSANPTAGNCGFGYFLPIGLKFDSSIINPIVTGLGGTPAMTVDQFTINVQETCTTATGIGTPATGPTTAAQCGTATAIAAGDPIPTSGAGSIALAKPTNIGVQTRDVFGSWIFNTVAGAAFGVSAEFVSPILPATVAAPGGYTVTYYNAGALTNCPQGGVASVVLNTVTCVQSGVNFRQDGGSGSTRNFRSTESLSTTLPIFTRVDLFGLNAAGEWVFIQRCSVPATIIPNSGGQGCGSGTVAGTDNGNERYWIYSFTAIPTTGFTSFRAIGVNAAGFGLASTRQP